MDKQRSEASKKRWASVPPEERSALARHALAVRWAGRTPASKPEPLPDRPCPHCGTMMKASRVQCGAPECKRRYHADRCRPYTQARRAAKRNIVADVFPDDEIFERDGWICQLCGEPVDRTLRRPDLQSPSLDHIIPLAVQGTHTRANVQLAHLSCNLKKGAQAAT